jgi:hypothetical protein
VNRCRIADNTAGVGGGISNLEGATNLNDSIVSGNTASATHGGGIYVSLDSEVNITQSMISDNTAEFGGGGIFARSTLNVYQSTLSGNTALYGGGIYSVDTVVTLRNSTLSGNTAWRNGGGIDSDATTHLMHCTVTGNSAGDPGGGISAWEGRVDISNTIVAGNGVEADDDCDGGVASWGYNLVGSGTGCPSNGVGDQTTSDPLLGALADNGGPTQTHALLTGSPARDAAPAGANGCGNDTTDDQRGVSRPIGGACDAGAYEDAQGAFIWDNGSGDGNWSTAANWSTNTVPTATDEVVFDNTSDANAVVDAEVAVAGVLIAGGYDGVIYPGSSNLTVNGDWVQSRGTFGGGSGLIAVDDAFALLGGSFTGSSGRMATGDWTQSGGTFAGGGTLDLDGAFDLSGGVFTAPPGLMSVAGGFHHTGGTFDPNGGRVVLVNTADQTLATTFYDLVINDGLLGYWKLDEGTGTAARDTSGYGHDGALANGATWSTDIPGTMDFHDPAALSFDGDNDYVDIASTTDIDNLQQFTLAAWVKLDSLPAGNMRFITLRNEKAVLRYDDQALDFFVKIDGALHHVLADNALSASGAWVHVAGTYDGSTLRAYLNGTEQPGVASVSGVVGAGAGIHLSSDGETLDGLLDDVRVYSRALAADEIGDLAAGAHPQTSVATTTLAANLDVQGNLTLNSGVLDTDLAELGYWKFDEGSDVTTADASGHGHDGTLTGGPTWTVDAAPASFSNPFALAFDGVDDRVLIDTALSRPQLAFTYALWFKPAGVWNASSSRKDLLYGQSGARPAIIFNRSGDGKIGLYTTIGGVDQNNQLTTRTAWTAGTWYHLAFTWDGSQVVVYVDGVQQGSPYAASGAHSASSGLSIGADPNGANPADAIIDDVRIYDRALTAGQVQSLATGDELYASITLAGDFTRNGGVFEPGEGLVTFDGAGTQTLDTDAITFYDVTVNSGATLLTRRDFTATGVLTNNGTLQQTKNVVSGGVAFLYTGGYGGLSISSANLGGTTVAIRGNQDCTAVPGETVRRCFDIAPAAPNGAARVQFYFTASELAGNTCNTLTPYHWNGSAWDPLTLDTTWGGDGRVCESEPYSIRVYPVTDFSPFVLSSTVPLAVTLASFDASVFAGGSVLLAWETVSEIDNAGFSLYRSLSDGAPETWLAFVPSQAPGSSGGFAYTYIDQAVQPGVTYWYWLEDVDLDGRTTLHGPVSATPGTPLAVTLAGLAASSPAPAGLPLVAVLLCLLAPLVWRRRQVR